MNESEGLNMEQSRERFANEVDVALAQSARRGCGRFLGVVMQPFLGFDDIVPDSSSPATV